MLEAIFVSSVDEIKVSGLTQWDRGQVVKITCPDLPSAFQVHFAKRKRKETIVVQAEGADNVATVVIPDELLQDRFDLYAYLYFDEGLIGETVKTVRLPIKPRVKPDDYVIDLPQEQATDAEKIVIKLMDEYIAKEIEAVTSASESATKAETAADIAESAAEEATSAAESIQGAVVDVEAAEAARIAAEAAKTAAETARDQAQSIAGGDFLERSIYDPQNKKTDVFAYVDNEVANIPTPDVSGQIDTHNSSSSAHPNIRTLITNVSRNVSDVLSVANEAKDLAMQAMSKGGGGGTTESVTLYADEWTAGDDGKYVQTVSVEGVTDDADQVVVVDVALSDDLDADATMISNFTLIASNKATPGEGTITFKAAQVPTENIELNVGVF